MWKPHSRYCTTVAFFVSELHFSAWLHHGVRRCARCALLFFLLHTPWVESAPRFLAVLVLFLMLHNIVPKWLPAISAIKKEGSWNQTHVAGSSGHHCTSGDVAFGIIVVVLELFFWPWQTQLSTAWLPFRSCCNTGWRRSPGAFRSREENLRCSELHCRPSFACQCCHQWLCWIWRKWKEILTATGDKANGGHKGSDGQDSYQISRLVSHGSLPDRKHLASFGTETLQGRYGSNHLSSMAPWLAEPFRGKQGLDHSSLAFVPAFQDTVWVADDFHDCNLEQDSCRRQSLQ